MGHRALKKTYRHDRLWFMAPNIYTQTHMNTHTHTHTLTDVFIYDIMVRFITKVARSVSTDLLFFLSK